ncbi:hypothetical protein BKA57DRAFT_538264 [Linnemannia elongata]|nr:hypothetical protein BKA57DRAFT_538264 [Linnemannia elongata]
MSLSIRGCLRTKKGQSRSLFLLLIEVLLSTTVTLIAMAQSSTTAPPAVSVFQWAVLDEKTLYIQGGNSASFSSPVYLATFYSLDLTKPFQDSQAPWTTLPTGPSFGEGSMVVSVDKTKLYLRNPANSTFWTYLITGSAGQWTNMTYVPASMNHRTLTKAVMDPDTGVIFTAGGYDKDGTSPLYSMLGYNIISGIVSNFWMGLMPTLVHYSAVWSTVRKSILVYGGSISVHREDFVKTFYEYIPATNTWLNVTTTGTSPGILKDHCMVPAYNGTRMVVFGGYGNYGVGSINKYDLNTGIYFLDTKTLAWTSGMPANSTQTRANMACAVAGDSFLAWGGDNDGNLTSNIPIIYNMRTEQWVSQFDPTVQSPGGLSGGGSNSGAIAGGVTGAVVVVIIGVFFLMRLKQDRNQNGATNHDNLSALDRDQEEQLFEYVSTKPVIVGITNNPQEVAVMTRSHSLHLDSIAARPSASDEDNKAVPRGYAINGSNPHDGKSLAPTHLHSDSTASQCVSQDLYVVTETSFRNPQMRQPQPFDQPADASQSHAFSLLHTLPPGAPHAPPPGVPHALLPGAPQQQQQQQQQPTNEDLVAITAINSLSSPASSYSSYVPLGVESKVDLAKRQMMLMQQQYLLNLERLRIKHEVQLRKMEEKLKQGN